VISKVEYLKKQKKKKNFIMLVVIIIFVFSHNLKLRESWRKKKPTERQNLARVRRKIVYSLQKKTHTHI
jgi:hypothetical protein